MHESLLPLFALILGLLAGFIGGIATGGGLLAIPGLMAIGLPPSSAIATNNLNSISSISSAFRFHESTKIQFRRMLPLIVTASLGSLVGSKILLHLNQITAQRAFGIASIILALSFALSKNPQSYRQSSVYTLFGVIAVFLGSVFAGLFGTGGGFFVVYTLCYFYGLSVMEANANTKIINLGGALSIILVFLHAGLINFKVGVPMMVGSTIGGYIGAHTALKKGEGWVKGIFLIAVIASSIKLILG